MASASPARDYDDQDEDEPSSLPSDSQDLTPAINCDVAGENGMYGQFTWTVALPAAPADKDSLADISKIRQFSDVFEVGGYEWKLEMYPYGDSQSDKTLSVFLCAVDRKQLPGWSQTAHYQIAVVNKDPSKTSTHTGYDIFRGKRDSAWGWSKLINLSKLHDASQGWVDDDGKITLQATVHVVNHEYMPVIRTYRKSLCGLYYERVLQSYFEPFLKDELQRLDKLCGNSVLHKGFSDFWGALPDAKKRILLQITMDEVLLNVKARLFSRDQPATYLAADVIFKAAHDCTQSTASDTAHRSLVGCTSLAVVAGGGEGTVLRLERLAASASDHAASSGKHNNDTQTPAADQASSRVMLRTHGGVMRMSNSANFVDVFRAQVSDALDNVRALVKHLKPQSCDGTCLEAMGRQMLAVFAMCGMYITNVHPAYHEKLALQLQEDLIREEEEKNQKVQQKKAKAAEKKKKQQEQKALKKAEEEEVKKKVEEEEKRKAEEAKEAKRKKEEEAAKKKAEARRKAQEEAEKQRKIELEAEEKRKAAEEAKRREKEDREAAERAARREEEEAIQRQMSSGKQQDKEMAKQSLIKRIMRDESLNHQEKQLRVQAIWAGKVDVAQLSAMYDKSQQQQPMGAAAQRQMQQNVPSVAAPAPVPVAPAATRANTHMPPYNPKPGVSQSQLDLDVEAVALSAMGTRGMGIDEDDIMAMALGTLDPPHQEWNVHEAAMGATSNHGYGHHPSQSFAPYDTLSHSRKTGFNSAAYDNSGYDNSGYDNTAYNDAGSAAGSRLFERWAGQGLGGGPANSRLGTFVNDGGQSAGYANGFNGQYNGYAETDQDGRGANDEPHRPLGSRRVMH